jgi:probable rRNA maturation factor
VSPAIRFFKEEIVFSLQNRDRIRAWIKEVIIEEQGTLSELNFIFCGDSFLYELNKEFLGHKTLTDIITFPGNDPGKISGEIYISIERVRENAISLGLLFDQELKRVVIHGVLHLLGYKDKTKTEKTLMRLKEDHHLSKAHFNVSRGT